MRFLAVGEAMVDVVAPACEPGRSHAAVTLRAGGSAITAALAAHVLGCEATVVARVGADPAAALLRAALDGAGIAARFAVDSRLSTGSFVQVGERIVADRGANAAFATGDLGSLEADALLVSGYVLLAEGTVEAGAAALAGAAAWVAVDAASVRLIHAVGVAEARRRFEPAGVLLANAVEATALTGLGDPEAAARELAPRHEVVVVKVGAEGAVGIRGDLVARAPAPPSDPWLGDGDAFDAGVLVGLARGLDLDASLALGCEAAVKSRSSA